MTTVAPSTDDNGCGDCFFISINGKPISSDDVSSLATVSIFDQSFHRGDGVFEVMRIVEATGSTAKATASIRSFDQHMTRLQTSAKAVGCPLPPVAILAEWLQDAMIGSGHRVGTLRLIATKGNKLKCIEPIVVISWSPLPKWPETFTLHPVLAPWHPAGLPGWETPIKWTSYGANVVSSQKAKDAGYTDALLLSPHRVERPVPPQTWKDIPIREFHVLDGPNFAVGFVQEMDNDGAIDNNSDNCSAILHLPCNETLGLLPSITQGRVATIAQDVLGMTVKRGVYTLGELLDSADEVFVMSTTRGVKRVTRIGDHVVVGKTRRKGGAAGSYWSDRIAKHLT